jgi:hypothetical protein
MADGVPRVIQDLLAGQLNAFEMRLEGRELLRRQSSQEPVGAMISVQNLRHGEGSVHRRQRG